MPSLIKSLTAAAAACALFGVLPAQAATDCSAQRGCAAKFCEIENDIAAAKERGGKIWCVFGCGGNRDSSKRPRMGSSAQRLAQQVVITSDNPRNEEPMSIIEQILEGTVPAANLRVEADRAKAIAETIAAADAADVVLIAGKGHENYQEVRGERHHFSDVEQARAALGLRGGTA